MKKTETLVSMVEYVLEYTSDAKTIFDFKTDFTKDVYQYAKFQDIPLTLGMFVACSESGEVLSEPKVEQYGDDVMWDEVALLEYQQALERVVFPDFHVTYSGRSTVIESPKQKIEIVFYSDRIELNGIIVRLVSDLVGHNIQYYTQLN